VKQEQPKVDESASKLTNTLNDETGIIMPENFTE
jgi:hypothetical protein